MHHFIDQNAKADTVSVSDRFGRPSLAQKMALKSTFSMSSKKEWQLTTITATKNKKQETAKEALMLQSKAPASDKPNTC